MKVYFRLVKTNERGNIVTYPRTRTDFVRVDTGDEEEQIGDLLEELKNKKCRNILTPELFVYLTKDDAKNATQWCSDYI
jgi:hypothetical protein